MGSRDLQTLKKLVKDVELGGPDWYKKPVMVPQKPRDQSDEEAMKEWRCKGNVAILLHMKMLNDIGLVNMKFDVQERKRNSPSLCKIVKRKRSSRGNTKKRFFDEEPMLRSRVRPSGKELVVPIRPELPQVRPKQKNVSRAGCSISRVLEDNLRLNIRIGPPSESRVPVIAPRFRNKIIEVGGSEESIQFVVRRVLTATDVNRNQARLSIPIRQMRNSFLTSNEVRYLLSHNCITAMFIEPNCSDPIVIYVQKWTTTNGYQLVRSWTSVVERNQLEAMMEVELWTFRRGSYLGLALIRVSNQ